MLNMNKKPNSITTSQSGHSSRPQIHGIVRGIDSVASSPSFEGRFGRMFRTLPAAKFFPEDLEALGLEMTANPEKDAQGNLTATPETDRDDEESLDKSNKPIIAAGFTYLGQFIDHDLTFDPMSSLTKTNDPDQTIDFRTPRFDLDSVYGRGPDDQPYLYEDDGRHLKLGRPLTGAESFDSNACDLPRHTSTKGGRARALIGDPRNDENVIVSQLQVSMLRFHNFMTDHLGASTPFDEIQRQVRWYYQWVVLHDFLPTIVGTEMVYKVLPHLDPKNKKTIQEAKPDLRYYKWKNEPFIPIEFSGAAYRFGHSMVRPIYRLNKTLKSGDPNINGRQFIFTTQDSPQGLNGFREFPANWAIDWSLYFDMGISKQPALGVDRIQPAYKIDTSLVNPLGNLPPSIASTIRSLAARNLMRGASFGLPSGQDVAREMCVPVIPDKLLRVGKANQGGAKENLPITDFGDSFKGKAPLWFYILAEAQQAYKDDTTPLHLGAVGGRIVAEVFAGLLFGDSHSFLRQSPTWRPDAAFCNKNNKFGMAELIKLAIKSS
jgi:Animal haem peroxidase